MSVEVPANGKGRDGSPAWAYDEDGYCVCCGNGRWKFHMPECALSDLLDPRLERSKRLIEVANEVGVEAAVSSRSGQYVRLTLLAEQIAKIANEMTGS